jgi:hypothetical protein
MFSPYLPEIFRTPLTNRWRFDRSRCRREHAREIAAPEDRRQLMLSPSTATALMVFQAENMTTSAF